MPSKKPYIQIRTTDELIEKFRKICLENNRSISNMGETIIREFIEQHERQREGMAEEKQESTISPKSLVSKIG